MARTGIQIQAIEPLQFLDAFETVPPERGFAVESVQHDTFQQIAERQIVIVGKRLQDLQHALLHANAGLNALHDVFLIRYHITNLPNYRGTVSSDKARFEARSHGNHPVRITRPRRALNRNGGACVSLAKDGLWGRRPRLQRVSTPRSWRRSQAKSGSCKTRADLEVRPTAIRPRQVPWNHVQ